MKVFSSRPICREGVKSQTKFKMLLATTLEEDNFHEETVHVRWTDRVAIWDHLFVLPAWYFPSPREKCTPEWLTCIYLFCFWSYSWILVELQFGCFSMNFFVNVVSKEGGLRTLRYSLKVESWWILDRGHPVQWGNFCTWLKFDHFHNKFISYCKGSLH